MANNEEKISKFVQAITAYAEEQRDKIHQEVEEYKAERLQNVEREVLADAYRLIQSETLDIRGEGVREISRRDLAARKEVLNRRSQIMTEVFERVEAKITDYVSTSAYADRLRSLLSEMIAVLPSEGTVYHVAGRDAALLDDLRSLCPEGSRLETTGDIRLGGIRGVNSQNGRIVDNTLDARLESQHDWFTKTSGLTVE